MRALLLVLSTLAARVPTADACGDFYVWRPTVHAVLHSFALLDEERLDVEERRKLTWTRIFPLGDDGRPETFDNSSTAPGEKLASPRVFTLVGPAGTKVIQSSQLTWFHAAFETQAAPRAAVRIPAGEYTIALDGALPDSRWQNFAWRNDATGWAFDADDVHLVFRHGTRGLVIGTTQTTIEELPQGLVRIAGVRYLVLSGRNSITLQRI